MVEVSARVGVRIRLRRRVRAAVGVSVRLGVSVRGGVSSESASGCDLKQSVNGAWPVYNPLVWRPTGGVVRLALRCGIQKGGYLDETGHIAHAFTSGRDGGVISPTLRSKGGSVQDCISITGQLGVLLFC